MVMQATLDDVRRAACPSSFCAQLAELLSGPLFKALADPGRALLLVRLLEQRSPCSVSQLAAGSGVDVSVVSRQLSVLRGAGIIHRERRGKEVLCSAQVSAVAHVLRRLADTIEMHEPNCAACPCQVARSAAAKAQRPGPEPVEEKCT